MEETMGMTNKQFQGFIRLALEFSRLTDIIKWERTQAIGRGNIMEVNAEENQPDRKVLFSQFCPFKHLSHGKEKIYADIQTTL